MATYDYTIHTPSIGDLDYPGKIQNLNAALSDNITAESNRLDGVKAKTDFITVISSVNLNTMRTDIDTNTTNITTNANAISTTNNVSANNVLLGNDNGAGQDFQELTANEVIPILNLGTVDLSLDTTGSAATLSPGRNINGVAFDGSININIPPNINNINPTDTTMYPILVPTNATGNQNASTDAGLEYNANTNVLSIGGAVAATASNTLTLTNKTLTNPSINGQSGYGLVILDTPDQLITGSTTVGTWTQYDMSLGTAAAQAAATAGASKIILRVQATVNVTSVASLISIVYAQKNGLGGTAGGGNVVAFSRATDEDGSAPTNQDNSVTEVIINLDSNSDFEYQTSIPTVGGTGSYTIYMVGYYV